MADAHAQRRLQLLPVLPPPLPLALSGQGNGRKGARYPFILSIIAKKTILEGHAEQQMIATARVNFWNWPLGWECPSDLGII